MTMLEENIWYNYEWEFIQPIINIWFCTLQLYRYA